MFKWPSDVGGKTRKSSWLNMLRDICRAKHIKEVKGGKLIPSTDGQTLVIPSQATTMIEIRECFGGDNTWFRKVAATRAYQKDSDGRPIFPSPNPDGL